MSTLYVANGYVASGYYQTGISIDWLAKVIFVPQSFLTYNGGVSYTLDTNAFRLALRDIEDNTEGIVQPRTHNHNTVVTLGGIDYARVIEILDPYTITFEETGTPYSVALSGSNNNILDKTNLGTVQILSSNSAGLIESGGSDPVVIADAVWSHATAVDLNAKVTIAAVILQNKTITDPSTGVMTVYAADGLTPLLTAQLYETSDTSQTYRGQGAERRERLQ